MLLIGAKRCLDGAAGTGSVAAGAAGVAGADDGSVVAAGVTKFLKRFKRCSC